MKIFFGFYLGKRKTSPWMSFHPDSSSPMSSCNTKRGDNEEINKVEGYRTVAPVTRENAVS